MLSLARGKSGKAVTALTPFEWLYLAGQPFLSYHLVRVRSDIKALVSSFPSPVRLLDVGARTSHYTIGLKAEVYLLDVPRETAVQRTLGLGVTDEMLTQLRRRRSNVREYWVQDFFKVNLPYELFDVVTAVDVIEHVQEDRKFVEKAWHLLKPGGALYLTTPNGTTIPNRNPDHIRHYTAEELEALLRLVFPRVEVKYGEVKTACWRLGLGFWKPKRPLTMAVSLVANLVNQVENLAIAATASNSARLLATAWKE